MLPHPFGHIISKWRKKAILATKHRPEASVIAVPQTDGRSDGNKKMGYASFCPQMKLFANQFMSYGKSHAFFCELTPETDYYAWAFCVNSATNQPMGPLIKRPFRTKAVAPADYRNPMTFDFEVNGMELMVVPSVEDVDDYYVWSYINLDALDERYGGSLEAWALDSYRSHLENGTLRSSLCRGIIKDQMRLAIDETYIVAATAYDSNFEKTIYCLTFTYDGSEDFFVPRGHDD